MTDDQHPNLPSIHDIFGLRRQDDLGVIQRLDDFQQRRPVSAMHDNDYSPPNSYSTGLSPASPSFAFESRSMQQNADTMNNRQPSSRRATLPPGTRLPILPSREPRRHTQEGQRTVPRLPSPNPPPRDLRYTEGSSTHYGGGYPIDDGSTAQLFASGGSNVSERGRSSTSAYPQRPYNPRSSARPGDNDYSDRRPLSPEWVYEDPRPRGNSSRFMNLIPQSNPRATGSVTHLSEGSGPDLRAPLPFSSRPQSCSPPANFSPSGSSFIFAANSVGVSSNPASPSLMLIERRSGPVPSSRYKTKVGGPMVGENPVPRSSDDPCGDDRFDSGQNDDVDDGRNVVGKYWCEYCPKRFNRPSSLKIHLNTHTGEKPHQCTFPSCGRRFSVLSNMRRHARVHTREEASSQTQQDVEEDDEPQPSPESLSGSRWRNTSPSASSSTEPRYEALSDEDESETSGFEPYQGGRYSPEEMRGRSPSL